MWTPHTHTSKLSRGPDSKTLKHYETKSVNNKRHGPSCLQIFVFRNRKSKTKISDAQR